LTGPDNLLYERLTAFREDVFRVCLGFSRNAEDLCQDVYLMEILLNEQPIERALALLTSKNGEV
jgi:hypothetical protein